MGDSSVEGGHRQRIGLITACREIRRTKSERRTITAETAMRAMVLKKPGPVAESPLELRDVPTPEPGPGEVLIEVEVCGVCRTDLHVVEGDLPPRKPAIVPGHEVVGRVAGGRSSRFKEG